DRRRSHVSTTALTAVLAKLAGLNAAGKAAVGLAVATGAVGAAAGVPAVIEPETVVVEETTTEDETVVEDEVVVEDVVTDEVSDEVVEDGTEETEDVVADEDEDTDEKELPEAASFGQSVAADARDGGVDGQEIAARAHERNEARKAARDAEDV